MLKAMFAEACGQAQIPGAPPASVPIRLLASEIDKKIATSEINRCPLRSVRQAGSLGY